MKIICIECTAEDLKANRGLIDVFVDSVSSILDGVCGSFRGSSEVNINDDMFTDEDKEEKEEE